jgi:hypothetical protein
MRCPHLESCDLTDTIRSKLALLLWQREYCETERRFAECERYRFAESGQPIPAGMLPNGHVLRPRLSTPA